MRNEKQRRLKRLRCNPRFFIRWFLWGSQKCQRLPSKVCSMKEQTLRPLSFFPKNPVWFLGTALPQRQEKWDQGGPAASTQGVPSSPFAQGGNGPVFVFSFQSLSRDPRGDVAAKTWKLGTSLPPQQNLGGGQGWARGTPGVARPFTFTVGLAQG